MKKRNVMFLFAVLGVALQGVAQSEELPKFSKYVKLTSHDVNIRRQPSTTSEKCARWGWVSRNAKLSEWEHIDETVFAVIGESGDWYKVYLTFFDQDEGDRYYNGDIGYIMKKFCKDVYIKQLSLPVPNYNIKIINSGIYHDTCFLLDDDCLFIGNVKNGMFVFDNLVKVWGNVGRYYREAGTHFQKDIQFDFMRFIYGEDVYGEVGSSLDLDKLINSNLPLAILMSGLSKTQKVKLVLYGVEGDSECHIIANNFWF